MIYIGRSKSGHLACNCFVQRFEAVFFMLVNKQLMQRVCFCVPGLIIVLAGGARDENLSIHNIFFVISRMLLLDRSNRR